MIWFLNLWMVTNLFFCFPLYYMIYRYISTKPLISVNLVDLIYLELILHICATCVIGTIACIHCLARLEEGLTVDYTSSLIYAGMY